MDENLIKFICSKNKISYIIFDKDFKVLESDQFSLSKNMDIRESLWELVGLEDKILDIINTNKSIEIPMIMKNDLYYDLDIDIFKSANELTFIAYMQEKTKQTFEYTEVIREINKQTLIYDISDEKKQNAYYKQINKRLITFHVNLNGFITVINDACLHFFNLEKSAMLNKHFSNFFHAKKSNIDNDNINIFTAKNSMNETIFFHADVMPLIDNSEMVFENIIICQDITYLKQIKKELEYVSERDSLTGLSNRNYLLKKIDEFIDKEISISLCFIDIDNFNTINEEYGSHAGDMLLKHLSKLLHGFLENGDLLARVYADKFIIMFEHQKEKEYIYDTIDKLNKLDSENPLAYTHEDIINFTFTTLLASCPYDASNAIELLKFMDKKVKKLKIDKKLSR